MGRDAQVQRAQAAVDEEAVERAGHRADGVLHEAHAARAAPASRDDDRAADDVGVPAEVLRRRVHDDVGAELERALDDRRGERVVDGDERVAACAPAIAAMSTTLSSGFVGVSTQTSFVSGRTRARDRVGVGLVDEVVVAGPSGEHLVDQPVGAAVEVVGQHDVVAGLAAAVSSAWVGRHAAGERGAVAALELAERRSSAARVGLAERE